SPINCPNDGVHLYEPEFERLYFDAEKVKAEWQPQEIPIPNNSDLIYPELVNRILKVASEVYHGLGPGFIHRIYANACNHECVFQGLPAVPHKNFNVYLDQEKVGKIKFSHLAIADKILFLPVAIQDIRDIHLDNIKAWLRHCHMRLGVLMNFFSAKLDYVIVRV
ncbi:GxxExxY protein, partial [bacterium]|nr:GxxExxY protein [bacterium]